MGEKPKPWQDHRGCSHPWAGHGSSKQGSCRSLGIASLDKPSKNQGSKKSSRKHSSWHQAELRGTSGRPAGSTGKGSGAAQGKAQGLHCDAGLPQELLSIAPTWGAGPPATPHSPVLITISQDLLLSKPTYNQCQPTKRPVHNPLPADFRLPSPHLTRRWTVKRQQLLRGAGQETLWV